MKLNKCEICGCSEYMTLIKHHIDLDHKNNNSNNIMILCSNCHMKLHNKRFNDKPINLKKEIFNNERLEIELAKLSLRDIKVNQWLKSKGLI